VTKLSSQLAGLTDRGKVRANNEDAFCVDAELGLLVVADGMGGHQSGEKASSIAVSSILSSFKQLSTIDGEVIDKRFSPETNRLGFCLKIANQMIHEAAKRSLQDKGMGTTCTAACITDDRLSLAHVGDSRCYLIRREHIEQLTADHSLLMEKVRHGLITKEQASGAEQNILTRSLGTEPEVQIDLGEYPLIAGDVVVLCSDGLDKEVTNEQLLKTVMQMSDPLQLAQRLIDMANASGGRDNITVAVATIEKTGLSESIKGFFRR
jgi:serine/threonine protein phosphatase PrpC